MCFRVSLIAGGCIVGATVSADRVRVKEAIAKDLNENRALHDNAENVEIDTSYISQTVFEENVTDGVECSIYEAVFFTTLYLKSLRNKGII